MKIKANLSQSLVEVQAELGNKIGLSSAKLSKQVGSRGGKSGRFREYNSQKIFSKNRFDRIYLGKHHGQDLLLRGTPPKKNSLFKDIIQIEVFDKFIFYKVLDYVDLPPSPKIIDKNHEILVHWLGQIK